MCVAHGNGGDEIAVEQRGAGKRKLFIANHTRLIGLRERRRQRSKLMGLLAAMPGERADERVEQQRLAVLPRFFRNVFVSQCGGKPRQNLSGFLGHYDGDP